MRGHEKILVSILDGPIDLKHPCLAGAQLHYAPGHSRADVTDGPSTRHGTAVASIIFGQPGTVLEGIAPACRGVIVPIYEDTPQGSVRPCSQADLAEAIQAALREGAQIINISGGQLARGGSPDPTLVAAVQACEEAGVLVVAAAGNDGCDCEHVPAALPTVLAVGAVDVQGGPLPSSNWGEAYRENGITAPGGAILAAAPSGEVEPRNGTSFACAVTSGIAAWMLGEMVGRGLPPDPLLVRRILRESADPADGDTAAAHRLLSGRLNLTRAFDALDALLSQEEEGFMTDVITDVAIDPAVALAAGVPAAPAPAAALPEPAPAVGAVRPSGEEAPCPTGNCGTSGNGGLVYALGEIGIDYVSESRRQSLGQMLGMEVVTPGHEDKVLGALAQDPTLAPSFMWTLVLDGQPIYAIVPMGAYAAETYVRLREFLNAQITTEVERVSIPGTVFGSITLASGFTVPILVPEMRGMYCWNIPALVNQAMGDDASKTDAQTERRRQVHESIQQRIYYENRNLGAAPRDRAFNYAATRAHEFDGIIDAAVGTNMRLGSIQVEKSTLARQNSNCWDVKLTFFAPKQRQDIANLVARATVDVSDVIPVLVGQVRHWFEE
ncbi:S8 family serine peptidase [Azospirillum thermophilum]|uniref:Peptidase S8 n=1 Tax=Azospirillum thermophilum TaxID=2202148 RepID=A0A2S2CMN4_9PROT|nr:S8 family serine peptidase [Azospirillum thermophilum]AWK85773.1 peptidase S8 [Azospirillum thermophilum]